MSASFWRMLGENRVERRTEIGGPVIRIRSSHLAQAFSATSTTLSNQQLASKAHRHISQWFILSLQLPTAQKLANRISFFPFNLPARLIYTLREYPNTEDFVYLNRLNYNPNEYDPYSLEVMPFAAIEQDDFYTMSVRGITHYQDGISVDFASE